MNHQTSMTLSFHCQYSVLQALLIIIMWLFWFASLSELLYFSVLGQCSLQGLRAPHLYSHLHKHSLCHLILKICAVLSIHKERLNLLQSQSSQHWGMPMTVSFIYLARHCKLFIALAFLWHFLSLAYAWMMYPKLFFMVVALFLLHPVFYGCIQGLFKMCVCFNFWTSFH